MPVLDLQRRLRTVGKIRMGDRGQKGNPQRLKEWRITSSDRYALEVAARIYGGDVRPWEDPKHEGQWELYTSAEELNVVLAREVPPSQWYEEWSAGGCQHRCDGITDTITDAPCTCDPDARKCKLTTRVSVYLPELPALGVFMLESHGYYAATELMGSVEMVLALEQEQGQRLPMRIAIEPRTTVKDGKTQRYVVPVLRVSGSLAGLLTGRGSQVLAEMATRAGLDGNASATIGAAPSRTAIEGAPAGVNAITGEVVETPKSQAPAPQTPTATRPANGNGNGNGARGVWSGPGQCPDCHCPAGKKHANRCPRGGAQPAAAPEPAAAPDPVQQTPIETPPASPSRVQYMAYVTVDGRMRGLVAVSAFSASAAQTLAATELAEMVQADARRQGDVDLWDEQGRPVMVYVQFHSEGGANPVRMPPAPAEERPHTNVRADGTVAQFGDDDYDPDAPPADPFVGAGRDAYTPRSEG